MLPVMELAYAKQSQPTSARALPFGVGEITRTRDTRPIEVPVLVTNEPKTLRSHVVRPRSTEERLFEATALAKQWTSRVAMRLDNASRARFFRQLDSLHDAEEWQEGDRPVALDSYKTFVRAYVSRIVGGKPALALTPQGLLLAIWQNTTGKLSIEFHGDDHVRYIVSQVVDGNRERFAGDLTVTRLPVALSAFDTKSWFDGA